MSTPRNSRAARCAARFALTKDTGNTRPKGQPVGPGIAVYSRRETCADAALVVRGVRVPGIVAVALCGCLLPALPASAGDVGGSVAITTDYIYRGVSQTDGQPAAQAGV